MFEVSQFSDCPVNPGIYFESRCKSPACSGLNKKFYLFLGIDIDVDYYEEYQKYYCGKCCASRVTIANVGFFSCKWIFQGELETGGLITGSPNYSLGYEVCVEIKGKRWRWLQFKVVSIDLQESIKLKEVINSSFNFDSDLSNIQCVPLQPAQRFNDKNKQALKKEAERKRDLIYHLKKNLKDQQKTIKKLSKLTKTLITEEQTAND